MRARATISVDIGTLVAIRAETMDEVIDAEDKDAVLRAAEEELGWVVQSGICVEIVEIIEEGESK